MTIELKPFTECDFQTLKSWIGSEEELFQFAGAIFTYPLSSGHLKNFNKKVEGESERNNCYGDLLKDHAKRTSI